MPRKPPAAVTQPLFAEGAAGDAPLAAGCGRGPSTSSSARRHLVGPDGALSGGRQAGLPAEMVLWGPPGSGKTTLARLLADRSGGTWRRSRR